jgi:hypothetical protein
MMNTSCLLLSHPRCFLLLLLLLFCGFAVQTSP